MSFFRKILLALCIMQVFISCGKKSPEPKTEEIFESKIPRIKKSHSWHYFTTDGFESINLPQESPMVPEKPWTESVRLSSMASSVSQSDSKGYGIVNKSGIMVFDGEKMNIYRDESIFLNDTAESMVFSSGHPVFYLYRSTFFNERLTEKNIQNSRPFLVEFNPDTDIFFPLVSYKNLNLEDEHQISGFFWNGETWACSAKKQDADGQKKFSYFYWQPLVALADLNPALGAETFMFKPLNEEGYKKLTLPDLYNKAPSKLKNLLESIPSSLPFFISHRDRSGTSAKSYFHEGTMDIPPLTAFSQETTDGSCAVFSDGTVYVDRAGKKTAFRLPKLHEGFTYGEFCISGEWLYVAWEESDFFKTKRSGFIKVNMAKIVGRDEK